MIHFTPIEYMQIDLANNYGLDKEVWSARLNWFEANKSLIESEPLESLIEGLVREAKEPPEFLAGVLAYRDMLDGKPIGYTCGLDATASGIQLLSVMSGCVKSASTCNLVNTGNREDAYKIVYNEINRRLGSDISFPREDVKKAVLTNHGRL